MIPYEDVAGPEEDEDEHERHGYDVHKQTTILHNRNISLWLTLVLSSALKRKIC